MPPLEHLGWPALPFDYHLDEDNVIEYDVDENNSGPPNSSLLSQVNVSKDKQGVDEYGHCKDDLGVEFDLEFRVEVQLPHQECPKSMLDEHLDHRQLDVDALCGAVSSKHQS